MHILYINTHLAVLGEDHEVVGGLGFHRLAAVLLDQLLEGSPRALGCNVNQIRLKARKRLAKRNVRTQ